ncbi:MAG: TetR/AcrR family transcriptional regulator [Novosphingobium sp.]|nr:TetR/AcrR family transcriptional regulator [Novosphingobium sp.]
MATTSAALQPKRGRPSAARASAIDRVILETARTLFLAEGFDAVAMEQVAAAVGISKGTLYARHSSKEDLFTAVVKDTIAQWSSEASKLDYLLTEDIRQRLRHHAYTMAKSLMQPDVISFQRVLLGVQHRFPELAETISDIGYGYMIDIISGDIAAAAARDGIPARDPEGVARMIVSAISGCHLHEVPSGKLTLERLLAYADRTVELAMAARTAW